MAVFSSLFLLRVQANFAVYKRSTFSCIFIVTLILTGCSTTEQKTNKRASLFELATEQADEEHEAIRLSQRQREQKLAALYQSILTLEPDDNVRAQIEYRLVQMNTQTFEWQDGLSADDEKSIAANEAALSALIVSYQDLLKRFPNRADNEAMQYQLAKALDLQGRAKESLVQMELLLTAYPDSDYAAELNFRRGDFYYSFEEYEQAQIAYNAVADVNNNESFLVNSLYMSAWVSFKLNKLPEADEKFIALLDYLIQQSDSKFIDDKFEFSQLDNNYASLIEDVQRVVSISLSQQQQAKSLTALVTYTQLSNIHHFQHILYRNLADFLIKNTLKYDAELTYQAYIELAPQSLWAARYSLALINLYEQQGKFSASRQLKQQYISHYGVGSKFWQKAYLAKQDELLNAETLEQEVIPNLLTFSYLSSRRLYAAAQKLAQGNNRQAAFTLAAKSLDGYLILARLPQANLAKNQPKQSKGLLHDELLLADAYGQAGKYRQALNHYYQIAYSDGFLLSEHNEKSLNLLLAKYNPLASTVKGELLSEDSNAPSTVAVPQLKSSTKVSREAAYAASLTIRTLLKKNGLDTEAATNLTNIPPVKRKLLLSRNLLDLRFISEYSDDARALLLASQAAQYTFKAGNYASVNYFADFILEHYLASAELLAKSPAKSVSALKLTKSGKKQVQIASELKANSLYQQKDYVAAEKAYQHAMLFIATPSRKRTKLRNLLASCIYFQGQEQVEIAPLMAVKHYLRIAEQVPESSYRPTAEFDAGNILLEQGKLQQGIDVLVAFGKRYPTHKYSYSIPAKLASAYEQSEQWQLAADQLLLMINGKQSNEFSAELKREAQYTAAEYYLKAGEEEKALRAYRAYAHRYPKPFIVAQEVRLKMSEFYLKRKETNKQFFWYRKIVKHHDIELKKSAKNITARANYLASFAALGLGKAHQQSFNWTKLKLPLNVSLKRKQKSMAEAIRYYQKVMSYQLAEFVPQASFNLAQMYSQLAQDIMSSERPNDLDELALEEYEFVLEDLAIPFEDKAIEIHSNNAQRAWQNVFDTWVEQSFSALAELDPVQYNKKERHSHAIQAIH